MNTVLQNTAAVCMVLIAAEAVGRLCPENAMIHFVRGLAVLALLSSLVSSVFSSNWDISLPENAMENTRDELSSYVQEQTEWAVQAETERYLEGLLAAAGIQAEKIEAFTDISDESGIVLTKVSALFAFETDAQRGQVLLRNVLGDDITVEVKTDGR